MGKKTFTPEQIIRHLRESEIKHTQGKDYGQIAKEIGISQQTLCKWKKQYGGMQIEQAKKLKALEKENAQLKRAIAELTLDKLILKEAAEGNF